MSDLYTQLKATWIGAGITVSPAATCPAIAELETKRSLRLPDSFREYLLTINGMEEPECDEGLIAFHSLDVIDREWDWYESESIEHVDIVFADWSIDAHYYGLRTTRTGQQLGVYFLDGTHTKLLATSFDEFIGEYLIDPYASLKPW